MKSARLLLFVAVVLLTVVGVALAMEMSGKVTAVDAVKGTLTLTSGKVEVGFDCEEGSIIKDVKVGDMVTVVYTEKDGKKTVIKVTPMKKM